MFVVKIKKSNDAKLPSYAHTGDSGADLYSTEDVVLEVGKITLIASGVHLAIPQGYEAQVRPKSGLALKHGIAFVNSIGTIDSGYRGEIKVIAINLGKEPYEVKKGTKIGQLVFQKVEQATFEETEDLDSTSRNNGGFGSTGLH